MTKQEELLDGIKEWVLEIRQYLINTEFAPEPFTEPIDVNVLTIEFPKKLLEYLHSQGIKLPDGSSLIKKETPRRAA